jgi:transglutaminase-like putative cysteine protease
MAEHGLTRRGLVRIKQTETWIVLGWLFLLLSAAVAGITIALINQDWNTLWRTLTFGLLLGWSLGLFRRPLWVTIPTVIAIGALYVLLFPGGLMSKVVEVILEFIQRLPALWDAIYAGNTDLGPLTNSSKELLVSAWNITLRIQAWVAAIFSGKPAYDPIAASLTWNALVWVSAAWAGWMVEARHNVLLAATPAILLSMETLAYAGHTSFVVYLMAGSLLALLAVVQQGLRQKSWDQSKTAYPSQKGRQITFVALLITGGLVLFSAFASSLSIQKIRDWIDELRKPATEQSNDLGKSLGLIPGKTPTPDSFTEARNPGLPQDHLIGSGPELSQRVVMTVSVQNPAGPVPLYWRAFTYDKYTGDGWSSSTTEQNSYQPNQPLPSDTIPSQISIQQQVFPMEDLGGTVYAAGEPITVDLPIQAAWRSNADLFGVQTHQAESYKVNSLLPRVDEWTLRNAGQRYPDWVRERYLDLPSNIPGRVRALAIELTASEQTPYDRARAIESYLRTFPYTLKVSRPPGGRDVVDYFLFDLKTGYCDYYASSMVVLARAAGIPARLVIGYASGTYNLNSKRFVVTEADAHSWVEIYFPNIGWVTFEPTASRPELDRANRIPAGSSFQPTTPSALHSKSNGPNVWYVLGGLMLAVLLGGAWIIFREIHLNRQQEQKVAVEIYQQIKWFSQSLGISSGLDHTPYEFTALLSRHLHRLESAATLMPQLGHDLQSLMDEIVKILYRPDSSKSADNTGILQQWKSLRRKLWLVWIRERWRMLVDRLRLKESL